MGYLLIRARPALATSCAAVIKLVEGAKAIFCNGLIAEGPLATGAFYLPALLEASAASTAKSQEVFDPAQTFQAFETQAVVAVADKAAQAAEQATASTAAEQAKAVLDLA